MRMGSREGFLPLFKKRGIRWGTGEEKESKDRGR
jgi:hypothetical protein